MKVLNHIPSRIVLASIASLVWVWSVYALTFGLKSNSTDNIFLTKTYIWMFYIVVATLFSGAFILLAKTLPKKLVLWLAGTVCAITILLQTLSPIGLSTDYYRYLWQGRVSNAGQDNYALRPRDAGVEYANNQLFERLDWRDATSVYPPLAEMYFRLPAAIFDHPNLRAINFNIRLALSKLPNVFLFIVTGFLLYKITRRKLAAFVWLAFPFLQFELINSAHVDVLSITLLLSAFYALRHNNALARMASGGLVAAAGMVKITPFVVILPVCLYVWKKFSWRQSLLAFMGFFGTSLVLIKPFIVNDFGLLRRIQFWLSGHEFSIGNPLYELTTKAFGGKAQTLLRVVTLSALVAVVFLMLKKNNLKKFSYQKMLLFSSLLMLIPFISSPIVLPWYWITPFIVLFVAIGLRPIIVPDLIIIFIGTCLLVGQYFDRLVEMPKNVRQFVVNLLGLLFYSLVIVYLYIVLYQRPRKLSHAQ